MILMSIFVVYSKSSPVILAIEMHTLHSKSV